MICLQAEKLQEMLPTYFRQKLHFKSYRYFSGNTLLYPGKIERMLDVYEHQIRYILICFFGCKFERF